jgi:hypothetical protein
LFGVLVRKGLRITEHAVRTSKNGSTTLQEHPVLCRTFRTQVVKGAVEICVVNSTAIKAFDEQLTSKGTIIKVCGRKMASPW